MMVPTRMPLKNVSRERMKAEMHNLRMLAVQLVVETQKQFWTPTSSFVHGGGDVNSWNYSTRYYLTSQFEIDELVSQEKALLVRYRRSSVYRGKAINLLFTHLTKRFVETSREVRTWRCQIVGKSERDEPFMRVDVVGWLVIQPVEKGIVTHVCAHFVPNALETSRSDLTREENQDRVQELAHYAARMFLLNITRAIVESTVSSPNLYKGNIRSPTSIVSTSLFRITHGLQHRGINPGIV